MAIVFDIGSISMIFYLQIDKKQKQTDEKQMMARYFGTYYFS